MPMVVTLGVLETTVTTSLVTTAVVLVGSWALYWGARRLGKIVVRDMERRSVEEGNRARTLWSMVRRLVLISLWTVALLTSASIWGVPLAPFLAVGSAVGVAVGFGAQSLVKDVISGFFILAEDQYRIGHVVSVGGVAGVVEDIRPRVTVLRDLEGNVHYVPNGEIRVSSNLTQEYAQVVFDIGVAYRESVDHVLEVFEDEIRAFASDAEWAERVIDEPQILGVDELGDSAVTVRAVVKVRAPDRWLVKREGLRRIKNRFDAEGIEIPFPHLTVYRGKD